MYVSIFVIFLLCQSWEKLLEKKKKKRKTEENLSGEHKKQGWKESEIPFI